MSKRVEVADTDTCPCRAGATLPDTERLSYATCCQPWHNAGHSGLGATPGATMRSRYTAYVLDDEDYLLATWHLSTRPEAVSQSGVEWHGLDVIRSDGAALDSTGSVEFRARFERSGAPLELRELSSFVQENGRWFYLDGTDPDSQ